MWSRRLWGLFDAQPTCFAKYIVVDGEKHVVIATRRRVLAGEELTYDYHLPYEDTKIICQCGASACRKYMN